MARRCAVSGVARQTGNRVSHANNKRKHVFKANLQAKRVYVPELGRVVRIKVSTRVLRTIDKLGLLPTLEKYGLELSDVSDSDITPSKRTRKDGEGEDSADERQVVNG